ncbi:MAG: hypothetical protein ACM3TR_16770 [Caulobacteraceae bacterium]
MINKQIKIIVMICVIVIAIVGCDSEYDKLVKEYDNAYKEIVNQIDPQNVTESIHDNELLSKYEQLDELLQKIGENAQDGKLSDIVLLRDRHDTLGKLLERGLKWDNLKGLEKLAAEDTLESLKSEYNK